VKVVVSANNVVNYLEGGGHFWVYMQYVDGLRRIGCDVWWLEEFRPTADRAGDAARIAAFKTRLRPYGLDEKLILYDGSGQILIPSASVAKQTFRETDLLLNFHQSIGAWPLEEFSRTALVDIDPGLLQYWISTKLLSVPRHDVYFSTGETVGTPAAKFPDCGIPWIRIRPPVSLDLWPQTAPPSKGSFTTVSGWWGHEWVVDQGTIIDNNKRASFLRFESLPKRTRVPLELALFLDRQSPSDQDDRRLLNRQGWSVRHAHDVAGSPQSYQSYIQQSRGEFSCAKASCMLFENAWVSDRSLCYLASGRPVVVEDTGPSQTLPSGLGMLRFSSIEQAADALEEAAGNYERHSRAARELAELFDAKRVAESIVAVAA
jgi:hypothetical protein